MPPNERKGRVHTSTVTVAVLDEQMLTTVQVSRNEVEMRFKRDTGPGGQHRNKTDSCVVLTHKQTGVSVKIDGRSQHANRRQAFEVLQARLQEEHSRITRNAQNLVRSAQVGSGERGDKIRTYREQDDRVSDHVKGTSARLADVLNGRLELLD